jgi:hypothetical protein
MLTPVSTLPLASFATACACSVWKAVTVDAPAVTVTLATDAATTVICSALDVTDPDVAAMVAVPAVTPVMRPLLETAATEGLLDAHVKLAPVSTLPLASFATACACSVWFAVNVDAPAVTVTLATAGFVTVICSAFDVTDPDVAVMAAVPAVTPVMRPLLETVATEGLLDAHVSGTPVNVWPVASRTRATACVVADVTIDEAGALIATVAAVALVTVRATAFEVTDPEVAVMLVVPAATPVTRPLALTVATEGLLDAQMTLTPVSTLPLASFTTACACNV